MLTSSGPVSKERGTPLYMDPAPSSADDDAPASFCTASDVYSFAVMIWEMMCLQVPFAQEIGKLGWQTVS